MNLLSALICLSIYFGIEIYFNENQKHKPEAFKADTLPLTSAKQAPNPPDSRLLKRDGLNVYETRSHRYVGDQYMVFRNYKNYRGPFFMKEDDHFVFDVKLSTDEHGRRCNNDECKRIEKKCGQVLVFASSNVFGYGLNNNETIPARLEEKFPQFSVYNYGTIAGNYLHMLVQTKSGELKQSLPAKPTVVIFFWEHDGFARTYPTVGNTSLLSLACFKKNDETQRLEYRGNLMSCNPVKSKLMWNLAQSSFLFKRFSHLGFTSYEEKVSDLRDVFNEMKAELKEQFPSSLFVIGAIEHIETDENIKELNHIAQGLDIPVLTFNLKEAKAKFKAEGKQVEAEPYDRHPSAFLVQHLVNQIETPLAPLLKQVVSDESCYQ